MEDDDQRNSKLYLDEIGFTNSKKFNFQVLDYYKKFGYYRDLEQYFSLETFKDELGNSPHAFWEKIKSKSYSEEPEMEPSRQLNLPLTPEIVEPSSSGYEHQESHSNITTPGDQDNENEKSFEYQHKTGLESNDTSMNKQVSPSSSIKRLEWDSLADVGYGNDRKSTSSPLSTLERLALEQQYTNREASNETSIGLPKAESSPLIRSSSRKKTDRKSLVKKTSLKIPVKSMESISSDAKSPININISRNVVLDFLNRNDNAETSAEKEPKRTEVESKEIQTTIDKNYNLNKYFTNTYDMRPIPICIKVSSSTPKYRIKRVRRGKKNTKVCNNSSFTSPKPKNSEIVNSSSQLSRADSFEYMPGDVYRQNNKNFNTEPSKSSTSAASSSQSISNGSKVSLPQDLDTSITMLNKLIEKQHKDINFRKRLVKKIVEKLLSKNSRDDDTVSNILSALNSDDKKDLDTKKSDELHADIKDNDVKPSTSKVIVESQSSSSESANKDTNSNENSVKVNPEYVAKTSSQILYEQYLSALKKELQAQKYQLEKVKLKEHDADSFKSKHLKELMSDLASGAGDQLKDFENNYLSRMRLPRNHTVFTMSDELLTRQKSPCSGCLCCKNNGKHIAVPVNDESNTYPRTSRVSKPHNCTCPYHKKDQNIPTFDCQLASMHPRADSDLKQEVQSEQVSPCPSGSKPSTSQDVHHPFVFDEIPQNCKYVIFCDSTGNVIKKLSDVTVPKKSRNTEEIVKHLQEIDVYTNRVQSKPIIDRDNCQNSASNTSNNCVQVRGSHREMQTIFSIDPLKSPITLSDIQILKCDTVKVLDTMPKKKELKTVGSETERLMLTRDNSYTSLLKDVTGINEVMDEDSRTNVLCGKQPDASSSASNSKHYHDVYPDETDICIPADPPKSQSNHSVSAGSQTSDLSLKSYNEKLSKYIASGIESEKKFKSCGDMNPVTEVQETVNIACELGDNKTKPGRDVIIDVIRDLIKRYNKEKEQTPHKNNKSSEKYMKEIIDTLRIMLDTECNSDSSVKMGERERKPFNSNTYKKTIEKQTMASQSSDPEAFKKYKETSIQVHKSTSKHSINIGVMTPELSSLLTRDQLDVASKGYLDFINKEFSESIPHKKCTHSQSTTTSDNEKKIRKKSTNRKTPTSNIQRSQSPNKYENLDKRKSVKSPKEKKKIDKQLVKSVAYNLIIQQSDFLERSYQKPKRTMKEVVVEVPLREQNKLENLEQSMSSGSLRCHSDYDSHRYYVDQDCDDTLDLSERTLMSVRKYLERNRPDFFDKAAEREKYMKTVQNLRRERQRMKFTMVHQAARLCPDFVNNLNAAELRKLAKAVGVNLPKRTAYPSMLSEREMKEHTERIYKRLPEVQQKRETIRKEQYKRTNLIMLNLFSKNLQKKTLRGAVNIPYSTSIIKI